MVRQPRSFLRLLLRASIIEPCQPTQMNPHHDIAYLRGALNKEKRERAAGVGIVTWRKRFAREKSPATSRLRATVPVGTLKTGYPAYNLQVKTKYKTSAHGHVSCGSHLLAHGSSGTATCPVASAPATRAQDSSGTTICPLGISSRFLAQDSSKAATCPVGWSYGL
jgi:hypothetical protein